KVVLSGNSRWAARAYRERERRPHLPRPAVGEWSPSPSKLRAELSRFQLPRRPLPLMRVEEPLPDPDRLGRDLDQLVVLDVGDRLFQAHPARRGQADALVLGARRAEVGE